MGGWKLEVGKMVLYMAFPVGLFHFFNQPEYFEEWVVNIKRELHAPENSHNRDLIQQAITDLRKKEELKLLQALDKNVNQS